MDQEISAERLRDFLVYLGSERYISNQWALREIVKEDLRKKEQIVGQKIEWAEVLNNARTNGGHVDWRKFLDERQLKEIAFDVIYAEQFSHGTEGHNARLVIARMTELLDLITKTVELLEKGNKE